jgi:hypothetical protein
MKMETKLVGLNFKGEITMEQKKVKKPCISCVYFDVCGSSTRTETCKGRKTKTEQKAERSKQ